MKIVVTYWPTMVASINFTTDLDPLEMIQFKSAWQRWVEESEEAQIVRNLEKLQASTWVFDYIDGEVRLSSHKGWWLM